MKSKPLKLNTLTAVELIAKAVIGATALIVAECKESLKSPTRRIALGWITGPEDFATLKSAAARFPDTAFFGTADESVEHKNGTTYLKNDARCRVSWSVRAIPLDLLRCWSSYEDATNLATPETKTEAIPAAVATASVPEVPALPRPVALRVQPVKVAPILLAPALPAFKPLSELSVNRKNAFLGNCAAPESPFITDGRILLLKSACESKFAQSKTVKVGCYGPDSPAPLRYLKPLFDEAAKNSTVEGQIMGFATAKDVGCIDSDDQSLACITTERGDIVVMDAEKLRFIQQKTGADSVQVSSKDPCKRPVLLMKAGQPVGVSITCHAPNAVAAFKKMLSASSRFAVLASA